MDILLVLDILLGIIATLGIIILYGLLTITQNTKDVPVFWDRYKWYLYGYVILLYSIALAVKYLIVLHTF